MNHPHWIWTAHNFRRNAESGLALATEQSK
jgi:hypothetical protein